MERKNNTGLLVGLILMTILAAVFGYLYYNEHAITQKQETDIQARVNELATSEIKLDSISKQLDARILEVQGLGGDIEELQKVKASLENDRIALRKGTATMGKKIKEYEEFLTKKDTEIAQLREENQQLISQNETLVQAKTELETSKQAISDSLTGVISKNTELESKVTMAAALRARNVKVYAVSSKGKVREGENVKSKRIDKVRVDFILEKNPLTLADNKTIYLRIIDPTGATISDTKTGSGVFQYNGQEQGYTVSKDVAYTNNNQDVSILYDRDAAFPSGKYTIELYSEGFSVGEGSFSVK
jgi:predicted  nucleic acid-binding Zn-ribbon protein